MELTFPFLLTLGTAWWFYPIEEHISIPKIIKAREKRMEARRLKAFKEEEERRHKEEARRQQARKEEEARRQQALKNEAERRQTALEEEKIRLIWKDWSERQERAHQEGVAKFMEECRAEMKAKEQGE